LLPDTPADAMGRAPHDMALPLDDRLVPDRFGKAEKPRDAAVAVIVTMATTLL